METAKEKATELLIKFDVKHYIKPNGYIKEDSKGIHVSMYSDQIKQCALICVDEIINYLTSNEICFKNHIEPIGNYKFWTDVKTEINNL